MPYRRFASLLLGLICFYNAPSQLKILREVGSPEKAFSKLDDFLVFYMKNYDMKAGAFAIAKNGKVVYAKAITYAAADYPLTHPTSLFRVGSTSKPITSMAIRKLIENGTLKPDTLIQDILQYKIPKQDAKPKELETPGYYFSQVKLQHLLLHTGGWPTGFATTRNDTVVARAMNGGKLPVTKYQIAEWGAQQKQISWAGSKYNYSNYGFLLLGIIIEKVTGETYGNAIRRMFFRPTGILRPGLSQSLPEQRQPGEVLYHVIPEETALCVLGQKAGTVACPIQYGGENVINRDSYGGWLFSPVDYVKLLGLYRTKHPALPKVSPVGLLSLRSDNTISNKGIVWGHGGDVPGGWAYMAIRNDSVDFMFAVNTTVDAARTFTYNGKTYTAGQHPVIWHRLLDEIKDWPGYDLSPAYFGNEAGNLITSRLKYSGIWQETPYDATAARARTAADFETLNAAYEKRNYKLQQVQTTIINGQIVRDGIWTRSGRDQVTLLDKPAEEYKKAYSEHYKQGYRLIQQEAFVKNGQLNYNGIWIKSSAEQFVTWEKSLDEIISLDKQMRAKGLQMIHQQTYVMNGRPYYNAIWNKTGSTYLRYNRLPFSEFRKTYGEQFNKSYRLVQLQAYHMNGEVMWDGIFAPGGNKQVFHWDMPNEQYDVMNIVLGSKMQPQFLTAY